MHLITSPNSNAGIQRLLSRLPPGAVSALALALLVMALWLPYGFNISGQSDEWVHMATVQSTPFTPRSDIRPLLKLPWAAAHLLTPDSFVGVNVLLAASLYVKGLALYGIIRRLLPANPALAYAAGALLIVYPGDFGTFNLSMTGINISVACWLAAANFLLVYWQKPHLAPLLAMWGLLFLSLGIVEIAYPLVAITPLLLVFVERGFRKRMIRAAAMWYAVPVLIVGLSIVQSLAGSDVLGYQSTRLAADNSIPALTAAALQPYRWLFWDIWAQVIVSTPVRLVDVRTVITIGVVVMSTGVLVLHTRTASDNVLVWHYGLLAFEGLGVMALGFAVFLPSILRDLQERTLLFTQVGAALVLALAGLFLIRLPRLARYGLALALLAGALVIYAERSGANRFVPILLLTVALGLVIMSRFRYALVVSGCIGLFMGYGFTQHEIHIQRGWVQQPFLTALARAVPHIEPNTVVLIFNEAGDEGLYIAFWRRNDIFGSAVQFVYADPSVRAFLCWNDPATPAPDLGECRIDNEGAGVVYDPRYQPTFIRPLEYMVALTYAADGTMRVLDSIPETFTTSGEVVDYEPYERIKMDAPLPRRLSSIFNLNVDD